ncbi:MAG: hypothetical protein JSV64_00510 [Candidatus Bathyarchaeota archaeon]|jgi:hypothetical protein|nr:MAG: hypothetical protein JSV64_00510 [Candidatus Bathyarchaeota archaeon]
MIRKLYLRGRPRGVGHSSRDNRTLEYLSVLASKYGIIAEELFKTIVSAWQNGSAKCHELTVKCRMKNHNHPVFLITRGYAVAAQFPVPERILEDAGFLKALMTRKESEPLTRGRNPVGPNG